MPEAPRVGCAMDGIATDVYYLEGGCEVAIFTMSNRERPEKSRRDCFVTSLLAKTASWRCGSLRTCGNELPWRPCERSAASSLWGLLSQSSEMARKCIILLEEAQISYCRRLDRPYLRLTEFFLPIVCHEPANSCNPKAPYTLLFYAYIRDKNFSKQLKQSRLARFSL